MDAVRSSGCDDVKVRILIVEDDRRLAELLGRRLTAEGHDVEVCGDGREGLERASAGSSDAVILDVMLPGLDGLSLARELRSRAVDVPVLMLTARDAVEDRVRGLRAGADDYLVKPFAFDELRARLEALGRRRDGYRAAGAPLTHGPVSLNPRTRRAWVDDRELDLTAKEFDLLHCLLEHRGRVLTRTELKELVWDYSFDAQTKVVDLYVHYLRKKLGLRSDIIQTVRGIGYAVGR